MNATELLNTHDLPAQASRPRRVRLTEASLLEGKQYDAWVRIENVGEAAQLVSVVYANYKDGSGRVKDEHIDRAKLTENALKVLNRADAAFRN